MYKTMERADGMLSYTQLSLRSPQSSPRVLSSLAHRMSSSPHYFHHRIGPRFASTGTRGRWTLDTNRVARFRFGTVRRYTLAIPKLHQGQLLVGIASRSVVCQKPRLLHTIGGELRSVRVRPHKQGQHWYKYQLGFSGLMATFDWLAA